MHQWDRPWDFEIDYVSSEEPSDIFLSYSSRIASTADDFLETLPAEGTPLEDGYKIHHEPYRVFRDVKSIRSGEIWDQSLIEAVFKTRVLLPLISEHYLSSPICMFELLLYLNRFFVERVVTQRETGAEENKSYFTVNRAIIPYRVEECSMPPAIFRYNAPLIPSVRPLPTAFMNIVRESIISAVSAALALRLGGGGGWVDADLDHRGLRDPREAAVNVIGLCSWFAEDLPSTSVLRQSLRVVEHETRAFLSR